MRKAILLLTALAILVFVNLGIAGRERLVTQGRVVLLELAPVDPRSLMQGDYMALRFKVANDAWASRGAKEIKDGHVVLALDERGVASFKRFADGAPLAAGEVQMRYRVRNKQPKFGTNAYFFEEGSAKEYERARYGEFRVAPDGEAVLVALRGEKLEPLGVAARP